MLPKTKVKNYFPTVSNNYHQPKTITNLFYALFDELIEDLRLFNKNRQKNLHFLRKSLLKHDSDVSLFFHSQNIF